MNTTNTLQENAQILTDCFHTVTLDVYNNRTGALQPEKESILCLSDECLKSQDFQDLSDLLRSVPGSMDMQYQLVHAAAEFIAATDIEDVEEVRNLESDFADDQVDAYNTNRTAWLAAHLDHVQLCNEAVEELGADYGDVLNCIAQGQYLQAQKAYEAVFSYLEKVTK